MALERNLNLSTPGFTTRDARRDVGDERAGDAGLVEQRPGPRRPCALRSAGESVPAFSAAMSSSIFALSAAFSGAFTKSR